MGIKCRTPRVHIRTPVLLRALVCVLALTPAQQLLADGAEPGTGSGSTELVTANHSARDSQSSPERVSIGLQGRPRWEFGVGGGFFEGFDYPGSTDTNRRQFAVPFFVYRSERFRFGGGGVSAVSIEEPRLKLDWSVAASLNSSNQPNSVRAGMEDLDFLIEFGPKLVYRVIDTVGAGGEEYRMDWSTKLRGVVSTDFSAVAARGLVFETTVAGRVRNIAGFSRVALIGGVSVRAASERLNDYFYEVPEAFVTDERPAFDGRAGLIDVRTTLGVALNLPKRVRVFIAASTGFYDQSANRNSPLHRALRSTSIAVGIVWTIRQSKARVGILETE